MSQFSISDLGLGAFSEQVRLAGAERELQTAPEGMTRDQVRVLAQAFEQILTGIMVEQMRRATPQSGLLPETPGHDLYEQMLHQEYLRSAGERGLSLGLAEALERQFADHIAGPEPADAAEVAPEAPGATSTSPVERRQAGI